MTKSITRFHTRSKSRKHTFVQVYHGMYSKDAPEKELLMLISLEKVTESCLKTAI